MHRIDCLPCDLHPRAERCRMPPQRTRALCHGFKHIRHRCEANGIQRQLCVDIEQRLTAQIQLRNNRRLQAAMRSSRLPVVKQLHDFDFTFQPSHDLGFVERRENVIFLGPPGVGKTHLTISLAIAAAQSGRHPMRFSRPRQRISPRRRSTAGASSRDGVVHRRPS